jgi:hypothetical protein
MRAPIRFFSCLLSVVFIVPSVQAQQAHSSASAASSKPVWVRPQTPDLGEASDGAYRNRFFGFTLKLPYGWVDRTSDLRQQDADAPPTDTSKSTVLLATFQRPPDAAGDTVNSAIVIAAESLASYPGLKDPSQYFGPIGEIAKANDMTAINQPYDFPIDGMPIVRQDFSKKLHGVTMFQSSMAMLQKGYALSFTFIAGNQDDITQNLDDLRFGRVKAAKQP